MRFALLILTISTVFLMNTHAQSAKDLAEAWEKHHISNILPSNVRHKDLQNYLGELKKLGLKVEEVGRSYGNREIYQVEFGKGATRIFMWSQMHGDEPTATSALIDMFVFLQKNRDKDWVKKIEETLTIRAVPMLNPDGTELFQRRNLQYIDINRDAQSLETPEGRLLKKLRDDWSPQIGFNLHNQNALTTVGNTTNQAIISLLAVAGSPDSAANAANEGHQRNKRLCAAIVIALNNYIQGSIGRYNDSFNPRAFGDMFGAWGTPTILIETGGHHGKDEMFAVKLNFIAFLSAFQALVTGSEKNISSINYDLLPNNSSGRLFNFIFRQANIINIKENLKIFTADVAINADRRRAQYISPTYIQEIGDLSGNQRGLEEYEASGFYLVSREGHLRTGERGDLLFYKKDRQIDWNAENFAEKFPPDAIFSLGRWIKGVLPKKP